MTRNKKGKKEIDNSEEIVKRRQGKARGMKRMRLTHRHTPVYIPIQMNPVLILVSDGEFTDWAVHGTHNKAMKPKANSIALKWKEEKKNVRRVTYKSNDFFLLSVVFVLCVISPFVLRFLFFFFVHSFIFSDSLPHTHTRTHLQLKTMSVKGWAEQKKMAKQKREQ